MPILPIVDLLILLGTASLGIGFVLKALALTTIYRPHILGFTSLDFALISAVCFGMALVLVARTWLKLNEPDLLNLRTRIHREEAQRRAQIEQAHHGVTHARETPGAEARRPQRGGVGPV